MQGSSKVGRPGSLHIISGMLGRCQTMTAPPHLGHHMTGTTVVEVSLAPVVVSQVLTDISLAVISSVEALSGIVVIVDVIEVVVESRPVDVDSLVVELGTLEADPATACVVEDDAEDCHDVLSDAV